VFVLAAIGLGLGSLVDDTARASLGGVEYLSFLAPGLMPAFAMQGAANESLWPVLAGFKWERGYVAQVATPLRPVDVLLGQLSFIAMRIAIGVVMTFVAMVLFGALESPWGVLAVPVAVLTGLAFAAPLTAFVATQDMDTTFTLIMRLGILPSYLFSGTFFPVSQLPWALEAVAKITPLWHGVTLCRSLALGDATALGAAGHVAYLLGVTVVGLAWGRRTFQRRLHQ
jgi:lipooligosaccharide transport system permease protein